MSINLKIKNFIFLLLVLVAFKLQAQPKNSFHTILESNLYAEDDFDCDACGCAASGGNFGYGDLTQDKMLSVRYLNQRYRSKETLFNNAPWSTEDFHTIQALGLIKITPKIKTLLLVPYHFLERSTTQGAQSLQGIGDVSLLGIYEIMSKISDKNQHFWYAGAGVKFPTGNFDTQLRGNVNPGFQLGTGSFDYSLLTEYQWVYQKFGWQSLANYTIKTENKYLFQFGNQLNLSTLWFYRLEQTKFTWTPQVGYAFETNQANSDFRVEIPNSDGYIHLLRAGFEMERAKMKMGTTFFLPLQQNLINETVELKHRVNVSFQYTF